ncbi:helix-turn-helix domain-containing protein [Nocardiopsis sediminis]|uniref:Helix-turn-helix domain-containing protein n=1 Tax=Nocardiopsis sediminis TaxID=1778267 RepID=A0ABV8FJN6_9ACTN
MAERPLPAWSTFGREVRRLRAHAGLSLDQVAKHLSITPGMLSKIERATRQAKKDTAAELDQFFRAEGAVLRRWAEATNATTGPDWFRQILRSEEQATEIRSWGPILCPGYLQIPEYARAVFRVGRPLDRAAHIERLVAGRVERYETLTGGEGPTLWAVLCETVLTRMVGGTEVMRKQLTRLADLSESGLVRIQVVPADTTDSPGNSGPFRLLTTSGGGTLLYSEGSGGGQVIDALPEIRRHTALFGELQGVALPPKASYDLIRKVRDGF